MFSVIYAIPILTFSNTVYINVFIFIISLEKNPETTQPESIPPVTIPKKTEPDKFSEQNYEMLRKIKHDINDTKQTIYTLMLSNDYDSVLNQLEGIESGLIKPDTYVKTENSVFNAVINSKFTFANQLGIKTTVATGSTLSSIDDFDLSRLLSNLIDNAIEACVASSSNNKHISVIIAEDSDKYTVTVKNTGDRAGEEVVQCYMQDLAAKRVRPVKLLVGYQKITLLPGEEKEVTFCIPEKKLGYYDWNMNFTVERGTYRFYVGGNSVDCMMVEILR